VSLTSRASQRLPKRAPHSSTLATVVGGSAAIALMWACTASEEPRPAPIVARRLGGDSIAPGPMVVHCRPDDEACIPRYAVTCPAPLTSKDSADGTLPSRPLSSEEQAYCMNTTPDSATGTKR